MEFNDIPSMVLTLILIGMILGVGLLVFDKFGASSGTYITRTPLNTSVTWAAVGANVSLGTSVSYCQSVQAVRNQTGGSQTINYTLFSDCNIRNDGNESCCTQGDTCYVDFTWQDRNSSATQALTDMSNATSPIASDWLPLIVTIAILAIILGLVLRSFAVRRT